MRVKNRFYEELNSYRKEGESNRSFAKRLGVNPAMIRHWEQGMSPQKGTLDKITKRLGLDRSIRNAWAHATSPPLKREEEREEEIKDLNQLAVSEMVGDMDVPSGEFALIPSMEPRLDNGGGLSFSKKNSWLMFRNDWLSGVGSGPSKMFLKVVWERSMMPTLKPGDVVLIDTGKIEYKEGAIYAITIDDFIMIRRLSMVQGGRVRMIPDAEGLDFYEGVPGEDVILIGEVVGFWRSL